jgi:hypothetical protein
MGKKHGRGIAVGREEGLGEGVNRLGEAAWAVAAAQVLRDRGPSLDERRYGQSVNETGALLSTKAPTRNQGFQSFGR